MSPLMSEDGMPVPDAAARLPVAPSYQQSVKIVVLFLRRSPSQGLDLKFLSNMDNAARRGQSTLYHANFFASGCR
jgi:hypothetical protein